MAIQIAKGTTEIGAIENALMTGDLARLSADERLSYYHKICESLNLNPLTRPFEYITLNGKLTLYARKDCTEQLRKSNGVSITQIDSKVVDDVYIVTAYAETKDGRKDVATGAVSFGSLRGEAKANAMLKAETKAKRRVTLSLCGLGMLDETETETIPNAKVFVGETFESEDIAEDGPLNKKALVHNINMAPDLNSLKDAFAIAYTKAKKIKNETAAEEFKYLYDSRKEIINMANSVTELTDEHKNIHQLAREVFKDNNIEVIKS